MEGFGVPSGLVVNIVLQGEQAKQEFQQFGSQITGIINEFRGQVESTNRVLKNMFSQTKVNNFAGALEKVNAQMKEFNKLLNETPIEKLDAIQGAMSMAKKRPPKQPEQVVKEATVSAKTATDPFRDMIGKQMSAIMNQGITAHTLQGTQSIIRAFGTIASWIGRIRVIAQSAVKMIFNLIKSPFTLISNLLQKVSNALGGVFKAFEWVQYQFFMQFMNIWLFAKTIVPVLETFIEYNREIYNTWALANEEWGEGLELLKGKLLDINAIELDDKFGRLKTSIEELFGSVNAFDLGELLSDLGIALAIEYGRMPKDVASAFYQMASATVEFNDVLNFTDVAIKASVAGVTTLTVAVDSGIAAIYAFGKEMDDLSKIYDYQFATVKYGILRYEELAKVMGRVYAPAASLSDSFEQINEMYATMAFVTRVGLSPEMAGFGLARMYESLADTRIINNLKKLNIEVFDSIGNFRGLEAILGDLIVVTKGFSTATTQAMMSSLGFDMRARRVLRSLMNNYAAYVSLLGEFAQTDSIDNITGSMDAAFSKMQESFAFRVDQLKATWESLKITFSESVLDALVYYLDNISLVMRGVLGWLREGQVSIGGFTVSLSILVKHLTLFYGIFAAIATLSGVLKVALTPMGLFIVSFMALINSAKNSGQLFTSVADKFKGLGQIIKIISDYIQIFFKLLKDDSPLKAFSQLISMMFNDLGIVLNSMDHISVVFESFKAFFEAIRGLFSGKDYAKAMTKFFEDTDKVPENYGTVIAYRFGKIFNSIGAAIKQMLIDALGTELETADSVLATVAGKVYRFIMDVFAGIFGKDAGTFGLKDLFISVFETLGVVSRNSLGQAILNKQFIQSVGLMFGNFLIEGIKTAIANYPIMLSIAGFNITKEAFKTLLMSFNNLPAMLAAQGQSLGGLGRGLTFAGDFIKFFAVVEFIDVIFDSKFLNKLSPVMQAAVKAVIALSLATAFSFFRARAAATATGKVILDSLSKSLKAGVVNIQAGVVNIYTSSVNQGIGQTAAKGYEAIKSVASSGVRSIILKSIGLVMGALGILGILSSSGEKEETKTPAYQLDTILAMQDISRRSMVSSINSAAENLKAAGNNTASVLKTVVLTMVGVGVAAAVAAAVTATAGAAAPIAPAAAKLVAATGLVALPSFGGALPVQLGKASLTAQEITTIIREKYREDIIEGLVSQGVIKPDIKSIIADLLPFALKENRKIITDKRVYTSLGDAVQAVFTRNLVNILLLLDEEAQSFEDLQKFLDGMTYDELYQKFTDLALKDGYSPGYASMAQSIIEQFIDAGVSASDTILSSFVEELDNIIITLEEIDINKLVPYIFKIEALGRSFGYDTLKKEYDRQIANLSNKDLFTKDPTAFLAQMEKQLEANYLSTKDRMELYGNLNKLFITYFANVIDEFEVTSSQIVDLIRQEESVRTAYEASTGKELTADIGFSQIIDDIKKGVVSDEDATRKSAIEALSIILEQLYQYAEVGDLDQISGFYKLLVDIQNDMDLLANKISKEIYEVLQVMDSFMLPTARGIQELSTVKAILKSENFDTKLLASKDFWVSLFTGDIDSLRDKISQENIEILEGLFEGAEGAMTIASHMLSQAFGEGVYRVVINNIAALSKDKNFFKDIGLSTSVYDVSTGVFMSGSIYEKIIRDPVDTFSDYLIDRYIAIAGESEMQVKEFVAQTISSTFKLEGLEGLQEALEQLGEIDIFSPEGKQRIREVLQVLLSNSPDESIAETMKIITDVVDTLQLYLGDASLHSAFEAVLGVNWRSIVTDMTITAEQLKAIFDIIPQVAKAAREARKNLDSSISMSTLSSSGFKSMESFIEVTSKTQAFINILGALFGRESIMGDMMNYMNLASKFGTADLSRKLSTLDLSSKEDLIGFVNEYAKLLIEIGMLSEELYVGDVATGAFQKISDKTLASKINNELISTLEAYAKFNDFQSYFYREVLGKTEGNILTMDIPKAIARVAEVGNNLYAFIVDTLIGGLFNPEKWAAIASSGLSLGAIIQGTATGLDMNLMNALYKSSEDYASGLVDIFEELLKDSSLSELIPEYIKDLVGQVAMGTAIGSVTSLLPNTSIIGYGVGQVADSLMEDQEFMKKFISLEMDAVKNMNKVISTRIISNVSRIFRSIIDEFVPKEFKGLKLPILSGFANILSDITSNFIGNVVGKWIIERSAALGTELSLVLLSLNQTISAKQGKEFLTNEEVVKLSESLMIDAVNFIGDLIDVSFAFLKDKDAFKKFIGKLDINSIFKNTISFISKLSEPNKKVISDNLLSVVEDVTPQSLVNLLNEYKAIPEGARDQAEKLVADQWDIIKKFAAKVLFGDEKWKWVIDIFDIGLFRTAWQNLASGIIAKLSDRQDLVPEWLKGHVQGYGMGKNIVFNTDLLKEWSPQQVIDAALSEVLLSSIYEMEKLNDKRIKDLVRTKVSNIDFGKTNLEVLLSGMDIVGKTSEIADALMSSVRLVAGESFSEMSKLDLVAGMKTGLLSVKEMPVPKTLEEFEQQLQEIANSLTAEDLEVLQNLRKQNWNSMLMLLKPAGLERLGISVGKEYIDEATGDWKGILEQYTFVGKMLGEDVDAKTELMLKYMEGALESITTIGSSFKSIASSISSASEILGIDAEIFVKSLESVGVVADSLVAGIASYETAIKYQKLAGETTGVASVMNALGAIGGWAGVIAALFGAFAALVEIWKDSQKITEQQLIAIRQNTVALDSLTNILDSLKATVYGAPEGFIYGYANPTKLSEEPIATAMYMPTSKEPFTVNISINAANMDANEVASAVEDGVYKAYKRLR